MSEVHAASDTILLFRSTLVRSSHNFRHYLAFSTRPCLKFTQLRTPTYFFHLPLSEVHTTSDTHSFFRLALVRSSHIFGHYLAIPARPCPKFTQLQTLSCFFDSNLSEVHTTSDTILLFRSTLVRSSHNFRHTLIFSTRPCLKFTQLRTLTCFFDSTLSEVHTTSDTNSPIRIRPCPKFTQLRTQTRFFDSTLPEVHTTSDTNLLFRFDLVRSSHSFRH